MTSLAWIGLAGDASSRYWRDGNSSPTYLSVSNNKTSVCMWLFTIDGNPHSSATPVNLIMPFMDNAAYGVDTSLDHFRCELQMQSSNIYAHCYVRADGSWYKTSSGTLTTGKLYALWFEMSRKDTSPGTKNGFWATLIDVDAGSTVTQGFKNSWNSFGSGNWKPQIRIWPTNGGYDNDFVFDIKAVRIFNDVTGSESTKPLFIDDRLNQTIPANMSYYEIKTRDMVQN